MNMKLNTSLTPMGNKIHQSGIQIDQLKAHHVDHHFSQSEIVWPTTVMLIQLTGKEQHSLVIDSVRGSYIVKQSVKQLFKQLDAIRPIGRATTMKRLANFKNIYEYIPFVFCGLSLSPLKATSNHSAAWFAAEKVTHYEPADQIGYSRVWFKDIDTPFIMNLTPHVIHKRQLDAFTVREFGKSIGEQILMSATDHLSEPLTQYKLKQNQKELEEFQFFARESDVRQTLNFVGYEPTDEEVERIVRMLIGK